MLIRLLNENDIDAFRSVRLRGLEESPEAFAETPEEFRARPNEQLAELLQSKELHDGRFVLGAFLGEELCGVVGSNRHNGAKVQHIVTLWGMYVVPEQRGIGIAKALLSEFIEEIRRTQGVQQIRLCVESNNSAAEKLYETFGFRRFGTEPSAIKLSDRCYDEHHMILDRLSK